MRLLRALTMLAAGCLVAPAHGEERVSVLVLDLDGDELHLGDRHYAVGVDLEGDGIVECVTWTAAGHEEAFVWVDANDNGAVDPGELLSDRAAGTFGALVRMDRPEHGGNGDGLLSKDDRSWRELGLWIDDDRDGHASPSELSRLKHWDLLAIDLAPREEIRIDGGLNLRTGWMSAWRRGSAGELARLRLIEVGFEILASGCD